MAIENITDQNFIDTIESGVVLVDFWAPWCGPCHLLSPILSELDEAVGSLIKIVKINVDENHVFTEKYEVMSLPTMIIFKNGEPQGKINGVQSKEVLKDILKEYL